MGQTFVALVGGLLLAAAASAAHWQPANVRDRALPHYREGLEHLRGETWPEGAKAFERAIGIDPDFEMAYYGLGRSLMPQKRFVEAVAAYAKCRDLYIAQAGRQFTNQQEAYRYRQDQMTELDEVIRSYQQGPQSLRTAEALRQLQERKRQLQQTTQRGTNLATIEATVPVYVSIALGSAYFRLGQLPDAEREYKAAIAADPKTGEAHSNLAVVYLQTGRFDEAQKSIAQAKKIGFKVNPQLEQDIRDKKRGS